MANAAENRGMGRGGLDRFLGPPAGDSSNLPPAVENPGSEKVPERKMDCAGQDANEAVCEIANAEEEERERDSAT